jgi:5-methyltetrahydropteroyltriglutamate--homocysteine methyltransferase
MTTDRILTTHAGSLPRPPGLIELFVRRQRGEPVDPAELARRGHEALRLAIGAQARAGIDIGNNGEQVRDGFFRYVTHRMSGFGGTWTRPPKSDVERFPKFRQMQARAMAGRVTTGSPLNLAANGPVAYLDETIIAEECDEVAAAMDEAGNPFASVFMNAPSPGIVATSMQNQYYDGEAAYLAAIGRALKVEYDAIVRKGFILQIDAPDLALEAGMTFGGRPRSDFIAFAERVVATINDALAGIPRERVRLHVCWGNSNSPHDRDIALADIMPVLRQAKVSALALPFASPAHAHEFKVLGEMKLADDQGIVAGVIDTVTNVIEHPEVIADRIMRVAEVMGDPRRVTAGTDCGLETIPGMAPVAEDVAWAKLANLAAGARLASQRLFPGS